MTSKVKAFGPRLKWWREQRGLSQLALAGAAETSQRHLSFLESGRAEPSREMVLRLCRRARRAAAPAERADARRRLRAGVARERSQRPRAGAGQRRARLTCWRSRSRIRPSWSTGAGTCCAPMPGQGGWSTFLLGAAPTGAVNLADALVAPDVLRPFIENWEEVAVHFLRSVQADAVADGTAETAELLRRLTGLSGRAAALARRAARDTHAGAEHPFPQGRRHGCACSPPSRRSARRRT